MATHVGPVAVHPARGRRLFACAAAACISGYQRHLSPYKGFSCAYRVHTGGESCSQHVKRLLLEDDGGALIPRIRARFSACRDAHLTMRAAVEGARFGDAGWAVGLGQEAAQVGTWCIPTPVGCCCVSA